MHLPIYNHGVDLRPTIVYRDVAQDLHRPCLDVDVDGADVRAEGIHEVRRIEERGGLEPRLRARRQIPCDVGHERQLGEGLSFIRRARHDELPVLPLEVRLARLEQVCGDFLRLFLHALRREFHRAATDRRGSTAVRPPPLGRRLRVARDDLDVLDRDAELVRHDLRERGLLALAVRLPADIGADDPRRVDAHDRRVVQAAAEPDRPRHLRGTEAADLAVGRDADAEVPPLLATLGLVTPEFLVVDHLQGFVERALIVPRVVGDAGGDGVGKLVLGDQVLATHLDRIHADLAREQIDHPLEQEGRLGPTGTAIRIHRGCGRIHTVNRSVDVRDGVGPRIHEAVQDRRDAGGRRRGVPAEPRVHPGAQAGDLPVFGAAQRHVLDVVAAVDRDLVVLRPVLGPLHRPPQLHGREADQRLVGIARDLASEATTYFRRDDPDLVLGELGHHRQQEPVNVGVLARHPAGELSRARVVARARGARLKSRGQQTVLDDALLDRDGRFRECLGRVSPRDLPGERDVGRHFLVKLGRALLRGLLGIDHRIQGVVVHVDQVEGVPGGGTRLRHDHRDPVTRVPHPVGGEQRVGRDLEIAIRHVPGAGDRIELVLQVRSGVNGHDARCLLCLSDVHILESGVRIRATEDRGVQEARQLHVIGVRGLAGDESRVLAPLDAGAKERCHAGLPLP